VVMKSSTFWDITLWSPLKVNWRFRATWPPSSGSKNKYPACHLLSRWFLAWLILWPWRWRWHSPKTSVDFQWTTQCYIPEDGTYAELSNLCTTLFQMEMTDIIEEKIQVSFAVGDLVKDF
jgi:hypothetical protein